MEELNIFDYDIGDKVKVLYLGEHNFEDLEFNKIYTVVGASFHDGNIVYAVQGEDGKIKYSMDRFVKVYDNDEDKDDLVNHPNHYTAGGIECIDYLEAKMTKEELIGYCRGNAMKYLSRVGRKDDPLQEYKKAQWYLNKLIEVMQK